MISIWDSPCGQTFMSEILKMAETEDALALIPDPIRESFFESLCRFAMERGVSAGCAGISSGDINELFSADDDIALSLPLSGHILIMKSDDPSQWENGILKRKRVWNAICVSSPGVKMPGFRQMPFWGRIRPSDCAWAIEKTIEEAGIGMAAARWHEAMCCSFCEFDLALAENIMLEAPSTCEEICDFLLDHPMSALGSLADAASRSRLFSDKCPEFGPAFEMWKAGALDLAFDGRTMIHPAAMMGAGMTRQIKAILFAGQARVYLPLASEAHIMICRRMEDIYGTGWSSQKKRKENNDRHLREIGPLYAWLKHYFPLANREINLACAWMNVRNIISHNEFMPPGLALKAMLETITARREWNC